MTCKNCEIKEKNIIDSEAEVKELENMLDYKCVTEMEMCKILGRDWTATDRKSWLELAENYSKCYCDSHKIRIVDLSDEVDRINTENERFRRHILTLLNKLLLSANDAILTLGEDDYYDLTSNPLDYEAEEK